MRRRLGYDSILREQGWQPCGRANVCARLRQTVPLPIREQAWELYYEVEQLTRLAALQCGYPPDTRRTASVLELIRGILKNNKPLLTPPRMRANGAGTSPTWPGRSTAWWIRRRLVWCSTHARSAGMASSGVRPEPTWADASHAAPTSEPHPCRRPAARQARPIREEEGHAQTSAVSARRPAYGCPPRPFARGSTRNTSRPTNTATSHAHSNILPLLRERAR